MNRLILGAAGAIASLGVAACGSATAGGGASTPSPSARPGRGLAGNVAFGQLVQINGPTLILSNTNGDSTVTYASTTTITQTNTGTVADIAAGSCIAARGTKDASGMLTAASVTLSAPIGGSCTTFGGGRGGTFSPRPGVSPPAGAAGLAAARGQVKAVSGTSVTISESSGTTIIDVPTTVRVTTSTVVTPTALQTGECLTAIGTKASSGAVAARLLTITPPGASGCTAGFGRGGGGFGGGGFGGGGGAGSIGA